MNFFSGAKNILLTGTIFAFLSIGLLVFPGDCLAVRVKATSTAGKIEGSLSRIENNTLYIHNRGFDFRLAQEKITALHFRPENERKTAGDRRLLVLNDGGRIPFRRVVRARNGHLSVEISAGERRVYEYASVDSIYFTEDNLSYRIIYKNKGAGTVAFGYRPGKNEILTSRGDTWLGIRKNESLFCEPGKIKQTREQRVGSVKLWELPPRPGKSWLVQQNGDTIGRGKWLDGDADEDGSRSFRHRFPGLMEGLKVEGQVYTGSLLPARFKIKNTDKSEAWELISYPEGVTFDPCFLWPFLNNFLERRNREGKISDQ